MSNGTVTAVGDVVKNEDFYNYSNLLSSFLGNDLERILREYNDLNDNDYRFPISKILLVKSNYKDLRYPKLIQKIRL